MRRSGSLVIGGVIFAAPRSEIRRRSASFRFGRLLMARPNKKTFLFGSSLAVPLKKSMHAKTLFSEAEPTDGVVLWVF